MLTLKGPAGTGKSYCMKELAERITSRMIYTAPTNKATKHLRDTLTTDEYKPECRTIYSLLGLRLEANGEVKELTEPEDPVDLTQYAAVIVDEASMINANLFSFIQDVARMQKVKFIFLGDAAQLPPVKEDSSPIWSHADTVCELTEIRRHDNQILTQATAIRSQVDHPTPKFNRCAGHDASGGVWFCSGPEFRDRILDAASRGDFSKPEGTKFVAWRNVTVDQWNAVIRQRIFENAAESFWLPSDRIVLTSPAQDPMDSEKTSGTTDDEGRVERIDIVEHPRFDEFECYRLSVTFDDNRVARLFVPHERAKPRIDRRLEELASIARIERRKWRDYWEFKDAFHSVRHSYAITAHRSQGSTYDRVFVDWRDILLNRHRSEAFRCLYVAATRPRRELYFN